MTELSSLPLFHRVAGQNVLVLGEGMAAEPKRRLIERAGGIVIDDERRAIDEGVRIAFIAYDDPKACEVAAINCRCAGMLVNVVDRPELCDFTTPSILDRDPVIIAVGTNGASAGLAKHLRLRLERLLPPTLGRLAQSLFAARPALRERYPDGGERRRALDAALREGGMLDPLDADSHDRVARWLERPDDGDVSTGVFVAHVTSPDPEDLTLRTSRLLGEADAVCVQGDVPATILARARADAQRWSCDLARCPLARQETDALGGGPQPATKCLKTAEAGRNGLTVVLRWRPRDTGPTGD